MDQFELQKMTSLRPYVIGLGVREKTTVFGIVDALGNILCKDSVHTTDYPDPTSFVFDICDKLQPMVESVGGWETIKSMGIGAASGNNITQRIENAANLQWKGNISLASMFQGRLGIAVSLANDCTVAAMGEMTYGAARGLKDFICVLVNGGMGAGIVLNGLIFMGNKGRVGEVGHVSIENNNRVCSCGKTGCLESYVSRRGIIQTTQEMLAGTDAPSTLRDIASADLTVEQIAAAADDGDEVALAVLRKTGTILGHAMTAWASLVSPEAFVLVGEVNALCGKHMLEPILESLNENMFDAMRWQTKVYLSILHGDDASILYASALAWQTKEYEILL